MSTKAVRTEAVRTRSRIGSWFDHHVYSLVASLGRMLRKPWATGLTVGVMAIAFALPLGLWAVLSNLSQFTGDVQQSRQVGVYLEPGTPLDRAQSLAAQLRARGDVAGVELRSADEGLRELRETGGLAAAADALGDNPLPHLLRVTPRGDDAALAASLQALPGVDAVQQDAAWRQRLDRWLLLGERIAWVLAVLLGLGGLLVVGNTVRLDIQSRRDEIEVLQLLGATDGFVRRPFLYLGACYGLLSGLIALGLLTGAELALRAPIADLAQAYGSGFRLQGFDPIRAAVAVLGAGVLGWLGAGLVTGHYLRQTRSTGD
ncbi:cell division protein FtsX [Lysobacter xinjiangensis]|uniref:Cell division protein FtsX n=1 Tax=Cognatilysobacter xinjiangensis TaxID=546892 RepID=A0ABQ3C5S2_9GAMM|nr:permease-like cell division protein FtsX [Lysobacter xinjiangensis]GGZ69683.1 cell division protein FtsX [Lysobacter xinjiangensis]